MHGEADRQRAAGRRAARERQARRAHAEHGDVVRAGVHGEQSAPVVAQGHGALRAQPTARPRSARRNGPGRGECAVGGTIEDGDRIAGHLVGERVDSALPVQGAVGALRLERPVERRGRVGDGAVLLARRESRGGEREESEVLRHGAMPPESCGLTLSASREVTLTCGTADLARARYERVLILLSGAPYFRSGWPFGCCGCCVAM